MKKRQTRRQFLENSARIAAAVGGASLLGNQPKANALALTERPNILMISIDDLNDYVGAFGGYSGVHTPNIDRLAKSAVSFQRAYSAAPYCGASRSATLTGIHPSRSGVIDNVNILEATNRANALARMGRSDLTTVPGYFRQQGYRVLGGGKVFHGGFGQGVNNRDYDENSWHEYFGTDFNEIAAQFPGVKNYRDRRTIQQIQLGEGAPGDMPSMIGAEYNTLEQETMMPDRKLAAWATDQLMNKLPQSANPFFMAVGFYRPHIAMYVPQRFYDLYPLETIRVPEFRQALADLEDLPEFALKYLVNMDWTGYGNKTPDGSVSSDHYLLQAMAAVGGRNGEAQAIQAYLASISFIDECVGQVISALEHSGLRQNTHVVLWSDHGWFLGEKLTWQKYKIWEKAVRVPVIISSPGYGVGDCLSPISLIDLFPTMIDLSGGTVGASLKSQLDGRSLVEHLRRPSAPADSFALSTQSLDGAGAGNLPLNDKMFHSLRSRRWRYIRYPSIAGAQLSEELYDLENDPGETRNLLYWEPSRHQEIRDALAKIMDQLLTA